MGREELLNVEGGGGLSFLPLQKEGMDKVLAILNNGAQNSLRQF